MPDFLEKYKPRVSIAQAFDFDADLPDQELTFDLFQKIVLARKTQDAVFLAIGKMLKVIRDRKLYKNLDYENFSEFLASEEISFSREKAYLYIRSYELFVEHLGLDPEELGKMGVVRLMMLSPIIREIKNKDEAIEKIEELKDLRYNDFVRQVKSQSSRDGKPTVYFSDEFKRWIVNYYVNTTMLTPLGDYEEKDPAIS